MIKRPNLLLIAGSDSGGCAGIQADLRVSHHLQSHGTTVITAITAQNTQRVVKVYPQSSDVIEAQLDAIYQDFTIDAVKIGMLFNQNIIKTVAHFCKQLENVPLVVDPVCIATSGDSLLEKSAINSLIVDLIPHATLITPNLDEYKTLKAHGFRLKTTNTLITGGDEGVDFVRDTLYLKPERTPTTFRSPKIKTKNTHGSGCSLSTAIAVMLARGKTIHDSVNASISIIQQGIKQAKYDTIGKGHGPLNFD